MIKEKHAWFAEVWQQMKDKKNKSIFFKLSVTCLSE
jgi:hypothetical protein